MKKYYLQLLCAFFAVLFSLQALSSTDFANPNQYEEERKIYKQAMMALENKNFGQFEVFRSQLNHYPLKSYIDYEYLRRSFETLPALHIKKFIDDNKGSIASKRLHIEWLGHLARNAQWPIYKEFYSDELNSEVLHCYYLQAELALNTNDKPTYDKIGDYWIKPYSIHSSCDPVFEQWKNKGYKTQKKIWQRYQVALLANNITLTQYLSTQLNKNYLSAAKRLKNVDGNIDYWTNRLSNEHDNLHLESSSTKYILKIISNSDHKKSAYILEQNKISMKKEDLLESQRLIAWYFAKYSGGESAVRWIKKHTDYREPSFAEPMLRYAMQDKNWQLYKEVFKLLPAVLKNHEEWLYWYAITQEKLGYTDSDPALRAKTILTKLAQEQSFYGLVSAEKMNLPVFPNTQFEPQSGEISPQVIDKLSASIELYHIGELNQSNNDWFFTTAQFNEEEWKQAGMIAYKMDWRNRTIQAFGRAKLWTAGAERFPILYQEAFWKNAERQGVDPGWILAVARQESAFEPNARSPVGALGVLQLMPATAQKVARNLNMRYNYKSLLDPNYNITLGTKYLKDQLENYDNNYILATAAYNAGPRRVKEWLELRPLTEDWVHWVATIPYKETRGYVQNITAFSKIYNMKLEYLAKLDKQSALIPATKTSLR